MSIRQAKVDWRQIELAHVARVIEERGSYTTYVEGKGLGVEVEAVYRSLDDYAADHPADGSEPKVRRGQPDLSPEAKAARAEASRKHAEAVAYVASYTGSWGLPLDIRSDRRWGTKHLKLSERQVEALLKGRDRDVARQAEAEAGLEQARVNTEVANDDEYRAWLAAQSEATRSPGQEDAPVAPQRPTEPAMGRVAAEGFYQRGDVIFKVQRAVHGSGQLYAKQLVVADGTGRWDYAPGMIRQLTEADRLTLQQAEAFGKLYGICGVCGRILTDETSISRGIGPVCAGRLS